MRGRGVLLEAALTALFGLGVLHWLYVFGFLTPGFAGLSFTVADWPKEVRYYVALQQAVVDGRIPWYVSKSIQETRKFLANPEVPWSPDVALLRFFGLEVFLVLKVLLWYAAGFAGLLLIRQRYALSLVPFTFLFLLFAMNGHIVAHLAIGHSMWTGYFLLPFVFLYLMDVLDGADAAAVKLALVLFLMLLQGSLHVFVWCVLLLLLALAFRWRAWRAVLVAMAWTAALGACRLVPAAVVLFGKMEQVFISGYPSAGDLLAALVRIRPITHPRQGGLFGTLNWWEFDVYLGIVGLAWLLWFGIVLRFKGPEARRFAVLEGPLAVMSLLALDDLYAPVNRLGIPLLSGERVSSRLLIVPLVFLLVIAAVRMQRVLEASSRRPLIRAVAVAAAVLTALGLAAHSHAWSLPVLERSWPPPPHARDLGIAILDSRDLESTARDTAYLWSVRTGVAMSLLTLAAAAWRLRGRRGQS